MKTLNRRIVRKAHNESCTPTWEDCLRRRQRSGDRNNLPSFIQGPNLHLNGFGWPSALIVECPLNKHTLPIFTLALSGVDDNDIWLFGRRQGFLD
jgi:hypothetical protein